MTGQVLNLPGYNIGLFAMPFISGFLGPVGVMTTSLFDTGNAVVCLGGAYGVADGIKSGSKFSVLRILKALSTSVPFLAYLTMNLSRLAYNQVAEPVLQFAAVIKGASNCVALLMILPLRPLPSDGSIPLIYMSRCLVQSR